MPDVQWTDLRIVNLRAEYLPEPLGIDALRPRLSWQIRGQGRNRCQSAYQLIVSLASAHSSVIWDTGKVLSSRTTHVEYQGSPLRSRQRYAWRVRIWDEQGRISPFVSSWWETGLSNRQEWAAKWIGTAEDDDEQGAGEDGCSEACPNEMELSPAIFFRKVFELRKPLRMARLYASARGLYMPFVNGRRLERRLLTPGWTDYAKRITYQTYDITPYLHDGTNVVAMILGEGWYSGSVGFRADKPRHHYGRRPLLIAQIEWVYEDGSCDHVVTDSTWRYHDGPIRYSDFLMGECYDARREMAGWACSGFDEENWKSAEEPLVPWVPLSGEKTFPVVITAERRPQRFIQLSPLRQIADFGQNMTGWVRLEVRGERGTVITLRFGEMLTENQELYVGNFRSAKNTDTLVLRGEGQEIWEPHFTIHGFRYVEISSNHDDVRFDNITACVIHNDLPWTGKFECSSELVNQLQRNIQWSERSNFVSIPTDCPQRDERLGWLADAHIFARTAMYNMDVSSFFTKWLDDVQDAQSPDGAFPVVAPRLVDEGDGAPGWGDAGIIIPWTMYLVYGDRRILETFYPSMVKWVQHIGEVNPRYLWINRRSHDFGDWLSVGEQTPKDLLATAFWAYDVCLLARMAKRLGKIHDARAYGSLFRRIRQAFIEAFVEDSGEIAGNTQSAYALALFMHLLPVSLRQSAADKLVTNIRGHGGHLSTGFLGVSYLCPALSMTGRDEVAYRLLLNTTFPSWGYPVVQGATTMWERWDGWTRETGFHPSDMNSFNHYALGSIGEWLYQFVAGIDADPRHPGYEHILIRPHINPSLDWVEASYDSIRGTIAVSWNVQKNGVTLDVTIPVNTTATIYFPLSQDQQIFENDVEVEEVKGVRGYRRSPGFGVIDTGSGRYHFVSRGR
ncbi:MAG: glycoside hydrolase family 78 protein [Firmicutes bacterium]|uniref:alpha-L-rhamnosidase n=1 Tax=Sulfobacillus benefaciens TaxID=453960 RepID=A0A2T2XA00_9FIRM|nr:glycoside hydrolase family 78 protein [Bacillota bacterium]PSR31276.1 MAG: alpha-L-rhamnosidase [Sulfobacillus benefaciens]